MVTVAKEVEVDNSIRRISANCKLQLQLADEKDRQQLMPVANLISAGSSASQAGPIAKVNLKVKVLNGLLVKAGNLKVKVLKGLLVKAGMHASRRISSMLVHTTKLSSSATGLETTSPLTIVSCSHTASMS